MFSPLDLSNRRYLITGAASGIGRECAYYLSKLGAKLLLVDINEEQLEVTRNNCETRVSSFVIDLTNSNLIKEKVLIDVELNGQLNGIVHSAGISYISPLKIISEETTLKVFKINAYAGIELAKLFTNRKIYSGNFGSIVYISSVYGLVGSSANVGYAMSKGAIQSMTKALAIELATKGIRVNCIAPGFVKTEMADNINEKFDENYEKHIQSLHPLGWGKTDDIASAVTFLLSDMSKWVTGAIFNIDGGFTAQ